VAFADRAYTLCPLTFDYRYFQEELARGSLASLRARESGNAESGTQIGAALYRVAQPLDNQAAAYTDVLLVSDGSDMDADTLAPADALAKLGVPVHAVGVGNPAEGALSPVKGRDGLRTYLRFQGEMVRTKLEEDVLRQVARRTHGRYVAAC